MQWMSWMKEWLMPQSLQIMQKNIAPDQLLSDTHPYIAELQKRLKELEDVIATTGDRDKMQVIVRFNADTYMSQRDAAKEKAAESTHKRRKTTKITDNPTQTFHDPENQLHQISTRNVSSGFAMMSALIHEAEHANQLAGINCTPEQHTMYRLASVLYDIGENNAFYWNNYMEMGARTASAQFTLEAIQQAWQQDPNMEHAEEWFALFRHVADDIMTLTNPESAHRLNQVNQEYVTRWRFRDKELLEIFPEAKSLKEAKEMAAQFLHEEGDRLYDKAYEKLWDLAKEIISETDKIKNIIKQRAEMTEAEKQCEIALKRAKENNLPTIHQLPTNGHWNMQPLSAASTINCMMHPGFYNQAIYLHPTEGPMLFYDFDKTPRPWSVEPHLKDEYQRQHKNREVHIDENITEDAELSARNTGIDIDGR